MMRPTKELPSDTLLSWIRRRPRLMTEGIWRSQTSQRLPRFLPPNHRAAGHPDAEVACERVEPLNQRGLRHAGFGALTELCHQAGEGVLGRRPRCWHVLLHRTMSVPAVFLDEPAIRPHSFRMLEAYRAAGIPWPTVSSLPYTTAPEATGRGSQPLRSWRLQQR